jgi:hypothetical protein
MAHAWHSQNSPWGPAMVPPALDTDTVLELLVLLRTWNEKYIRQHPQTPGLYESGIYYKAEPIGEEKWMSIPWMRIQGHSVCHSLCAYRVADLRVRHGEDAKFYVQEQPPQPDGTRLYHVQVKRAGWTVKSGLDLEDPSAILGMNGTPAWVARFGPLHRVAPQMVAGIPPRII